MDRGQVVYQVELRTQQHAYSIQVIRGTGPMIPKFVQYTAAEQ